MFAIIEAYRFGLLKTKFWLPNIIAGLIVGVVALPLAMAFAIASGAKPEQGIYTAIIAALIVGLFGGSRVQIAGPTGAFIIILAGITARFGIDGLQIATLLAGIILFIMGMMRLGSVIKYIPDSVIVGFTAGIGVIIFVGEWKDFLGLPLHVPLDAHFHEKIWLLLQNLSHLNFSTVALASFSLFLVLITPKFSKRIPGPLVALIIATVLEKIFHFEGIATVGSTFGNIPAKLPPFHFPAFSWTQCLELVGPAFTIALLGAIESLLSAAAADNLAGTRHHSNQELIGQGLANIVAPLFGGFAATGAIARTATNVRNGGNSPIAALTHSLLLVFILLFLAPLAFYVPLCTLAAILFVVAYNMSDVKHFIHIARHAPYYDVMVLAVTFLLTVFTNLVIAVNVGVILAMLFFIQRMTQSVEIKIQTDTNLQQELAANGIQSLPSNILIYLIEGPFFFGVAEKLERTLMASSLQPKIIIFRLQAVPFMDLTGLKMFQTLLNEYEKHGIKVFLCEANGKVAKKITNMGILNRIEGKRLFSNLTEIFNSPAFSV